MGTSFIFHAVPSVRGVIVIFGVIAEDVQNSTLSESLNDAKGLSGVAKLVSFATPPRPTETLRFSRCKS
jgi:hypothetical protein